MGRWCLNLTICHFTNKIQLSSSSSRLTAQGAAAMEAEAVVRGVHAFLSQERAGDAHGLWQLTHRNHKWVNGASGSTDASEASSRHASRRTGPSEGTGGLFLHLGLCYYDTAQGVRMSGFIQSTSGERRASCPGVGWIFMDNRSN